MQTDQQKDGKDESSVTVLDAIVLVGLLFSCCLLPIAFTSLVVVSTWLATNTSMAPYRPLLLAGVISAIFFTFQKLYFSQAQCASGTACSQQRAGFGPQVIFWLTSVSSLYVLGAPYLQRYFY